MEKPLKILSINASDKGGGAARAAYRIHLGVNQYSEFISKMLVKDKQTNDKEIFLVSDYAPKCFLYKLFEYVRNKVKNKIQHYRWKKYPLRANVMLSDLRSIPFHGAFNKIDYDILHLHWINLRFLNINKLKSVNKPIVWTLHDSWAFTGICHYFYDCDRYQVSCGKCPFLYSDKQDDLSYKIWERKNKTYQNLNLHIVTPSQWLGDLASKSSLLGRFPINVIPNGLDTKIYSPGDKTSLRENKGIEASKKIILFGAVNPTEDKNKGFDKLIEAIRFIESQKNETNFVLSVFGTDKPMPIKTNIPINYLGYLKDEKDVVEAYRIADVMVVPSLSEVFGQTASEAMACGTPVVAFNCTGIKEVVTHKVTGYLAEPFDSIDLAKGIIWCIENNNDGQLSNNARKKVEENFTMEIVSKQYTNLYKSLLL